MPSSARVEWDSSRTVSVRPLLTQTTRLMPASFSAMALLAHGTQQFIDGEQGHRDEKCSRKEPHSLSESVASAVPRVGTDSSRLNGQYVGMSDDFSRPAAPKSRLTSETT